MHEDKTDHNNLQRDAIFFFFLNELILPGSECMCTSPDSAMMRVDLTLSTALGLKKPFCFLLIEKNVQKYITSCSIQNLLLL